MFLFELKKNSELKGDNTMPSIVKFGVLAICLSVVAMVMLLGSRFVRQRNGNKA